MDFILSQMVDPYAFPLPLNEYVTTVYQMLLRALGQVAPILMALLAIMVGLGFVRKLLNIFLR